MEVILLNDYYVYQHKNKTNGKSYFGITKQIPEQRWGANGDNYANCPHFWAAIQKYGWDNFEHIILAENLSKENACQMEIALIKEYCTQDSDCGYNIMEGGCAPTIPDEVRVKMSKSMQGNQNGLGHPCSEEKKKKISDAQCGRPFTKEHRDNISKAKSGKSHPSPTEETRKKISDAHKKKKVYCVETDTVYPSIQQCARELDLQATLVCRCCKGTLKSTGGYHLQYYDTINA